MNKLYKLVLLSFLFSLFLAVEANAQGFNSKYKYWSIGGTLNIMNYVGELDPGPSFISPGIKFTRYNLGAVIMRRLSPRISLRGAVSYGRIAGNDFKNSTYSERGGDINRKIRNLDFFSSIFEVKGDVVIDLIEHRGRYQKRPDFVPYVFIGLAYFHHNPKTRIGGQTYNLRDYSTEGQGTGIPGSPKEYSLNQIALPIGIGVRYKLSKQLDLAFEIGWRFTTTDYLDDVGGHYVDKNALAAAKGMTAVMLADRSPELLSDPNIYSPEGTYTELVNGVPITSYDGYGRQGDKRGDKKNKDAYIVTGVHLMYIIPSRVVCPKFR
ncbi:MAG TPA: DUF6089 family protein [Cytophagaceae bacterium]|nr:DUF6089 family protein [Cytophagaceae bacterium]